MIEFEYHRPHRPDSGPGVLRPGWLRGLPGPPGEGSSCRGQDGRQRRGRQPLRDHCLGRARCCHRMRRPAMTRPAAWPATASPGRCASRRSTALPGTERRRSSPSRSRLPLRPVPARPRVCCAASFRAHRLRPRPAQGPGGSRDPAQL